MLFAPLELWSTRDHDLRRIVLSLSGCLCISSRSSRVALSSLCTIVDVIFILNVPSTVPHPLFFLAVVAPLVGVLTDPPPILPPSLRPTHPIVHASYLLILYVIILFNSFFLSTEYYIFLSLLSRCQTRSFALALLTDGLFVHLLPKKERHLIGLVTIIC
jgi:hypothetical protein